MILVVGKTNAAQKTALAVNGQETPLGNITVGKGRKIHLHLGHGGLETLKKLFEAPGKEFPLELFQQIIQKCGWKVDRSMVQRPIVRTHIPVRCCDTIGLDAMYPIEGSGHARPYLIMVGHLSRFTVIARMTNRRTEHTVDLRFKLRAQQLGKPRRMISDRDPSFIGAPWGEVCDFSGVQFIFDFQ